MRANTVQKLFKKNDSIDLTFSENFCDLSHLDITTESWDDFPQLPIKASTYSPQQTTKGERKIERLWESPQEAKENDKTDTTSQERTSCA
eukprot:536690-Amphidinium_carterae.1